jgi:pyruvate/2-oxoglutarate dehydrogenase complex dihydrolipoamide dehydrogenase (E3) component
MLADMSEHVVDLVIIGMGAGGEALAAGAAKAGLQVVAVDKHLVGGECPYYACIPTKMMTRAASALAEARRVNELAGEVKVEPSWEPVAKRINREATDGWDDTVAVERLEAAGAVVHHGTGRLAGPGRVLVHTSDGETVNYAARRGVVLNPGTRPAVPAVNGLRDAPYWTNRDVAQLTRLPKSLLILGGGPIGCEIAQVMSRFDVAVTVLQHGERLLARDEPEASQALEQVFTDEGIRVLTGVDVMDIAYADDQFTLTLSTGQVSTAERLLVAAGRQPNFDHLGLESIGLKADARVLEVDERLRLRGVDTAATGVWAIGDVTGHGAYTHMSMYQQAIALADILGRQGPAASYHAVPHVTFTDPEVAGVGLTEQKARAAGLTVRIGLSDPGASSRGFTHGPGSAGVIKVVADADRGVLVGATVVGPAGGEILGLLTLAVHAEVPLETLRTMIYAYPTFHRAIDAALAQLT